MQPDRVRSEPTFRGLRLAVALAAALGMSLAATGEARPLKHARHAAARTPDRYGPLEKLTEQTIEHACLLDWDAPHMAAAALRSGWSSLERSLSEVIPEPYWGATDHRRVEGAMADFSVLEMPAYGPGRKVTYTSCSVDFHGDGWEAMAAAVSGQVGNFQREEKRADSHGLAWAYTERNDVPHYIDPNGLDSPYQAAQAARELPPGVRLVTVYLEGSRHYTSALVRTYRAGERPPPDPNLFQEWPRLLADPKKN